MATKTEYEVDESINAYVKDEETLRQMQEDGQLKPFSNYFTPDEDEGSGQLVVDYEATGNVSGITIDGLDINADGGIYDIVFEGYSPNGQAPLHLRVNGVTTVYSSTLMRVSSNNTATGSATGQFYTFLNSNETGWFIGDLVTGAIGAYHITLIADGNASVQMLSNFTALQNGMVNGGFAGGQLYNNSGLKNITSLYFWAYGGQTLGQAKVRIYKRATNSPTRS